MINKNTSSFPMRRFNFGFITFILEGLYQRMYNEVTEVHACHFGRLLSNKECKGIFSVHFWQWRKESIYLCNLRRLAKINGTSFNISGKNKATVMRRKY